MLVIANTISFQLLKKLSKVIARTALICNFTLRILLLRTQEKIMSIINWTFCLLICRFNHNIFQSLKALHLYPHVFRRVRSLW